MARDRNGIGFVTLTGPLPKEVRALPLAEKPDASYVTPKLAPVAQTEYPLGVPVVLHVHPAASQTTKDFARWATSPAGAASLAGVSGYGAPDPSAVTSGGGDSRPTSSTSKSAFPASGPSRPGDPAGQE